MSMWAHALRLCQVANVSAWRSCARFSPSQSFYSQTSRRRAWTRSPPQAIHPSGIGTQKLKIR